MIQKLNKKQLHSFVIELEALMRKHNITLVEQVWGDSILYLAPYSWEDKHIEVGTPRSEEEIYFPHSEKW